MTMYYEREVVGAMYLVYDAYDKGYDWDEENIDELFETQPREAVV